jgi:hypothetical protein
VWLKKMKWSNNAKFIANAEGNCDLRNKFEFLTAYLGSFQHLFLFGVVVLEEPAKNEQCHPNVVGLHAFHRVQTGHHHNAPMNRKENRATAAAFSKRHHAHRLALAPGLEESPNSNDDFRWIIGITLTWSEACEVAEQDEIPDVFVIL